MGGEAPWNQLSIPSLIWLLFSWQNKNMLILVQRHSFYSLLLTLSFSHSNSLSLNVRIVIYISKVLRTSWNQNSSVVNVSRINLVSTIVQTMLNVASFLVSTLESFLCVFWGCIHNYINTDRTVVIKQDINLTLINNIIHGEWTFVFLHSKLGLCAYSVQDLLF